MTKLLSKGALAAVTAGVLALGANQAQATYLVGAGVSGPDNTAPGASGTLEYDYTFSDVNGAYVLSGHWTSALDPLSGVLHPGHTAYQQLSESNAGMFSSIGISGSSTLTTGAGVDYSIGTTYKLYVDYTVSPTATVGDGSYVNFNFGVKDPGGNYHWVQQEGLVNVASPVPEPSTVVAGGMALLLASLPMLRSARARKSN